MTIVYSTSGKPHTLGAILGQGGEGVVRHIEGTNEFVAKIYTGGKALDRQEKIIAMVAAAYHALSTFVAFPLYVLSDSKGAFVGFSMRRVIGFKPIHELYSAGSRKSEFPKADYRFLVRTSLNVAKAVASIHQTGCIIGDINHSGILVSGQATANFIDSDSFQVRDASKIYRCLVGVGEYTPPELQGRPLESLDRTISHDSFGLAIVIFQLLFMGRHPFSGRYAGKGDMPIEKAIKEGRFAYSSRQADTLMQPPPAAPLLSDFPKYISTLFERAFHSNSSQFGNRPLAAEWVDALTSLEKDLIPCQIDSAHHHPKLSTTCPWCRLEGAMNITLFPQSYSGLNNENSSFSIEAIIRAINGVPSCAPLPDVKNMMPPNSTLAPSEAAQKSRSDQIIRKTLAALVGVGAIALMMNQIIIGFWGLPIALFLFFGGGGSKATFRNLRIKAEADWTRSLAQWQNSIGPIAFNRRRLELLALAEEHKKLPATQQQKLRELELAKEKLQKQKYLESHRIARATIPMIGDGRKATLASYGIDTAWDIVKNRITNVPGFGEALAGELINWRRNVERKFVFNPSIATDPAAILKIKNEISAKRNSLERSLLRGPLDLQQINAHTSSELNTLNPELVRIFMQMRQAQVDAGNC